MPKTASNTNAASLEKMQAGWKVRYDGEIGRDRTVVNRSGIEVRPLYTPLDWSDSRYVEDLGMPGELPYTRGIYNTMHLSLIHI